VKQLKAAGHVAGITGVGVNDAPALLQAEVGIAVSTATDVANVLAGRRPMLVPVLANLGLGFQTPGTELSHGSDQILKCCIRESVRFHESR